MLAWPIRRSSCRNGFAVVAQLAEQRPRNAQVTGPNPVDGSFSTKADLFFLLCLAGFREVCNRTGVEDSGNAAVAQLVERFVRNEKVAGSTPASSTSFLVSFFVFSRVLIVFLTFLFYLLY